MLTYWAVFHSGSYLALDLVIGGSVVEWSSRLVLGVVGGNSLGPYVQNQGYPTEFEPFQWCPGFDSEGCQISRSPLIVLGCIGGNVLF